MSVQVTGLDPVDVVRRFVEGSMVSDVFERLLDTDAALRAYLSSSNAPPDVGGPLLRYLRGLDWLQPKDVLKAQRALVGLLIAAGRFVAPTDRYERRARLVDQRRPLWSRVQPTWLNIPATYFATLLEECEGLPEDTLERAIKVKVRTLFRYRGRPPVWLHDETWPVNANGPLTFVEQIDISGPCDTSYRYVFYDEKGNENHELVQSTARFESTSAPSPAAAVSSAAPDFPPVFAPPGGPETVPLPVLQAVVAALETLDCGSDVDMYQPDPDQADGLADAGPAFVTRTSLTRPWVDPVVLVADDPTRPVAPPPGRWALEMDDGRAVELWSNAVVLGRDPRMIGLGVQRLTLSRDLAALLDTHARLDLIDGAWWVTNLGKDGGVVVVGASGRRVMVPANGSVPVRTHLGLGSVVVRLVPLPGTPLLAPQETPQRPVDLAGADLSTAQPVVWEPAGPSTGLDEAQVERTAETTGPGGHAEAAAPAAPAPGQAPWAPPAQPAPSVEHFVPDDVEVTVKTEPPVFDPWTLALDDGRTFPVRARSIVIGRRPRVTTPGTQALAVADATRTLSRTHARLDLVDGTWQVTDLGSTNGVTVTAADGGQTKAEPGRSTPVHGYVAFGSVEARLLSGLPDLG